MNAADQERLIEFLRKKMCGKCKRQIVDPQHDGCAEAAELIELVSRNKLTR